MIQKTTPLALLVLVIILVLGCGEKKAGNRVTISIQTGGSYGTSVSVQTSDLLNFGEIKFSEAKTDSAGNALLEFDLDRPLFGYLKCGEKFAPLYLTPGDDLKISMDSSRFSGAGAVIDEYLQKSDAIRNAFSSKNPAQADPATFSKIKDSLETASTSLLQKLISSNKITPAEQQLLTKKNEMSLRFFQQNYVDGHFGGEIGNPDIPISIKKAVTEIPFDTICLRSNMFEYGFLWARYLQTEIYADIYKKHQGLDADSITGIVITQSDKRIRENDYPAAFKDFFIAKNIDYWVNQEGISPSLETIYKRYITESKNSLFLPTVQKSHDKWLAIEPGKPAPDFTGVTLDGKKIALSDLKGKVVYMDVWATWCGPCKTEFPHSKTVKKSFEGNENVVFLYLSIDQNIDAWKKMVAADSNVPKGVHINQQQKKQPDAIWESYHIWGVPRYVLINQKGQIVQTHAPRPSSGKVQGLISGLLNSNKIALK